MVGPVACLRRRATAIPNRRCPAYGVAVAVQDGSVPCHFIIESLATRSLVRPLSHPTSRIFG